MLKPSLMQSVTHLFESPQGVSIRKLARDLDVSLATAYRIVEEIRATFGTALIKDKSTHRYRIDGEKGLEWPGIFMQSGELPLILAMLDWLQNTGEPSFTKMSGQLRTKIEAWIQNTDGDLTKWNEIIRILPSQGRRHLPNLLPVICRALFLRRKIAVVYRKDEGVVRPQITPQGPASNPTLRALSPQTLVHYRDSWYLDAFCHLKQELRTFSLHRVESVTLLDEPAKRIPRTVLAGYFADSYGIFAGQADKQAEIVFQGKAAEYIAHEMWHPKQERETLPNGLVRLRLPYHDPRELIRDLLRWCDGITGIKPASLRQLYLAHLTQALANQSSLLKAPIKPNKRRRV